MNKLTCSVLGFLLLVAFVQGQDDHADSDQDSFDAFDSAINDAIDLSNAQINGHFSNGDTGAFGPDGHDDGAFGGGGGGAFGGAFGGGGGGAFGGGGGGAFGGGGHGGGGGAFGGGGGGAFGGGGGAFGGVGGGAFGGSDTGAFGPDEHDDADFGSGDHGDSDHGDGNHGSGSGDFGSGIDDSGVDDESDDDVDDEYEQPTFPNINKGCAKGCARCFFGLCKRCKKGYKKSIFMTCIKRKPNKKTCRQIPNCKVCSGMSWLKSCKRCEKGWYKHTGEYDIRAQCVKKCPRGYKGQNSKRGGFCKKATPEGCVDYYCSMCKKGWYMIHKKGDTECHKQCPAGYYPMGNNFCSKCKRGCTKCSSTLKCESCAKRLSLFTRISWGSIISTRCLARCPRGYKKEIVKGKGSVCRQVCFVANCQRCPRKGHSGLHHHCDSCKPGYHLLHGFTDKCVKKCPKGFYAKKTHIGTICRLGSQPMTSMPTTWTPETTTSPEGTLPYTDETTTEPELMTTKPEPTTTEPEDTTTEPEPTTNEPEDATTEPEFTTTEPESTTITYPTVISADPDFSEPAFADEP